MIQTQNVTEAIVPEKNPGLQKLLACKCPRCRRGDMFVDKNPWNLKQTMKMHQHCQECGQPLNIEVGFYYGASYVAYALTVAFSVATFVTWHLFIGFSLSDDRLFYWLSINAVLMILMQPYFMRLARTGWLAIFTKYDPHWKIHPPENPERVNETQERNW